MGYLALALVDISEDGDPPDAPEAVRGATPPAHRRAVLQGRGDFIESCLDHSHDLVDRPRAMGGGCLSCPTAYKGTSLIRNRPPSRYFVGP